MLEDAPNPPDGEHTTSISPSSQFGLEHGLVVVVVDVDVEDDVDEVDELDEDVGGMVDVTDEVGGRVVCVVLEPGTVVVGRAVVDVAPEAKFPVGWGAVYNMNTAIAERINSIITARLVLDSIP